MLLPVVLVVDALIALLRKYEILKYAPLSSQLTTVAAVTMEERARRNIMNEHRSGSKWKLQSPTNNSAKSKLELTNLRSQNDSGTYSNIFHTTSLGSRSREEVEFLIERLSIAIASWYKRKTYAECEASIYVRARDE
uniref:Uncharacterized protein n=1 Tax=Pristionchus pacificus TaxID=54126 RepID=A0A2A6CYG4_PRIPA|eukprot:PDM83063.1 hypothetical protein PRIPAC_37456 [Pristionchus pacificus]